MLGSVDRMHVEMHGIVSQDDSGAALSLPTSLGRSAPLCTDGSQLWTVSVMAPAAGSCRIQECQRYGTPRPIDILTLCMVSH